MDTDISKLQEIVSALHDIQRSPEEALSAIFPKSAKVGGLVLRPITLLSLSVAARLGAKIENGLGNMSLCDMSAVAFACSLSDDGLAAFSIASEEECHLALAEWRSKIKASDIKAMWGAVDRLIVEAFSTVCQPASNTENPPTTRRQASA